MAVAKAKPAKKLSLSVLGYGYLAIALVLGGIVAWLVHAGPPPASTAISVTVPVETVGAAATAEQTPAAPAKLPVGMAAAIPFDTSDKRPRIAILVTELGPSAALAESAINHLPPEVSLAFLTFAQDTPDLTAEAHGAGHEVLLDVPMEPASSDDPGANALSTTATDAENLRRLGLGMAHAQDYVGIVNFMGSRFTASAEKLKPVLATLHDQNLLLVDTRANTLTVVPTLAPEAKVPFALADLTIDAEPSREAIDANLAQLEQIARTKGKALGIAGAYPVTADRIAEWAKALATKGLVLAPVSAVVTLPKS